MLDLSYITLRGLWPLELPMPGYRLLPDASPLSPCDEGADVTQYERVDHYLACMKKAEASEEYNAQFEADYDAELMAKQKAADEREAEKEANNYLYLDDHALSDYYRNLEETAAFNAKYDAAQLAKAKEKAETVSMPAIPADEQTLDHVPLRPFQMNFHDSTPREVMGPEYGESFWDTDPYTDIFHMLAIVFVCWVVLAGSWLWYLNRAIPVPQPAPVPSVQAAPAPVEVDWVLLDHPSNWATWPDLPQVIPSK